MTPSKIAHSNRCPWDYADVCAFLICVVMAATVLRLAIVLHLLSSQSVGQPSMLLQAALCSYVLLALYATLKFRHGGPVWRALGWTLPAGKYILTASIGGIVLASAVTFLLRFRGIPAAFGVAWKVAVLAATIGPVLEESFFRGCLLPLVARAMGAPAAVVLTAILFAMFHQPPTIIHCVCFFLSGVVYGWMRVDSGSTTAAALMHAAYNLTLFMWQRL